MTDGALRVGAALVGAPVAAVLVGCATSALPGPIGFAAGFHLTVPLWVALSCGLPLASGRVAWGIVAALTTPAIVVLLGLLG